MGLNGLLSNGRRLTALVVVHLGEVEERRLHQLAGHSTLFAYCVTRLKMSEDEAYRRIEVARLARGFPCLFEMLAAGRVSLSVAALLKPYLTGDNHAALLEAVCGKTVRQAREVLAAWFPRPDVPASIRKLPVPRGGAATPLRTEHVAAELPICQLALSRVAAIPPPQSSVAATPPAESETRVKANVGAANEAPARANAGSTRAKRPLAVATVERAMGDEPARPAPGPSATKHPTATLPPEQASLARIALAKEDPTDSTPDPALPRHPAATRATSQRPPATARCIEPLSADRYRVQLTASAELKHKLELARDLLRHAIPDGDLAVILERAMDLLLEQTMKRRFAVKARAAAAAAAAASPATNQPSTEQRRAKTSSAANTVGSDDGAAPPGGPDTPPEHRPGERPSADAASRPAPTSRHIPNDVRRAVLARDGLRCAWVAPDGTRCESQAWLEHDHITPRGRGGGNDPTNIRPLCRPHNRLAAELAYGQPTVARIIARRRVSQRPPADACDTFQSGFIAPSFRGAQLWEDLAMRGD